MPVPVSATKYEYDPEKIRQLYELFGVAFVGTSGHERKAESCPFCSGSKFSVNLKTSQYNCFSGSCNEKGNAKTFINWVYDEALADTKDDDYRALGKRRDHPIQTLKRNGLAYHRATGFWLFPAKSPEGKVQNLLRYEPNKPKPNKFSLPGLPLYPFGLDSNSNDPARTLIVCEGPTDRIAVESQFVQKKTSSRFDVIAVPSANTFPKKLLDVFKDRSIRLVFDNDKAGRDGQESVAKKVRESKTTCKLTALRWPDGHPDKCDMGDLVRDGVSVAEFSRENCVKVSGESRFNFVLASQVQVERVEWLYERRIQFGTLTTLSGPQGTFKSTIAKDWMARSSVGKPMPGCTTAVPPINGMYFTSEDARSVVSDLLRVHGADLDKILIQDIAGEDKELIDITSMMDDLETQIKERGVRFVVFDAINSFVTGDSSTDSKARRTVTGRLAALARQTGAAIIAIQNWGRASEGPASSKALGPISMSHVARSVMNTREITNPKDDQGRRFVLEFEKVTNAPLPKAMPFSVRDLSNGSGHLRRIVWKETEEQMQRIVTSWREKYPGKKVAEKGSGSGIPT